MATNSTPKWKTFLDWFGYAQSIRILWGMFAGLLAAIGVLLGMPHSPLTYLIAAAAFTGTWAVFGTLVWTARKAVPAMKRRRNPHIVATKLEVGEETVELVLRHHGEPATWYADAQILSVLGTNANPHPAPFQCGIRKGTGTAAKVRMSMVEGDWAKIRLASIRRDGWRGTESWLSIYQDDTHQPRIPDSGVILQVTLNASPPLKRGAQVVSYKIGRNESGNIIAEPLDS